MLSPLRLIFIITSPIIIVSRALRKKNLTKSGAFSALFTGYFLTLPSLQFFACLLTFFYTCSLFRDDDARNWIQVFCNGSVASFYAVLYFLEVGTREIEVDFGLRYRASVLQTSVIGAICCCCGDTWASELTSLLSSRRPVLITNGRSVPIGTNGAITLIGLISSYAGGFIVGFSHAVATYLFVEDVPFQWAVAIGGGCCGLVGSLVDSYLGATLQFSGERVGSSKIVHKPGADVKHISGMDILDNNATNFVSSFITAWFASSIFRACSL